MTIDAKELRERIERAIFAINAYMDDESGCIMDKHLTTEMLHTTRHVLRAHLATLPREVEVGGWAVVQPDGELWGLYERESEMDLIIRTHPDWLVVRLTGTALLPREKD